MEEQYEPMDGMRDPGCVKVVGERVKSSATPASALAECMLHACKASYFRRVSEPPSTLQQLTCDIV